MWYQRATKMLSWQRYLIIGIVVLGVVFALFGDQLLRPLSPTCAAPPVYHPDVPPALQGQLQSLYDTERLYCVQPPDGLRNLDGPVYWGSDGVNSLLFFQLTDPTGIGLARYAYGQDFLPGSLGGPPPNGYVIADSARPAYVNEAPKGASYFLRTQGAPADADFAVDMLITGPAIENKGMFARDIWRDLENLWRTVRGESEEARKTTTVRGRLPILPDRWIAERRRVVAPEFATAEGDPDLTKLRAAAAGQPKLYQVLNGPLGSGIWLTGVGPGTTPALTLVPESGGVALQPAGDSALWTTSTTPARIASFAFPPLASGTVYEARYWNEGSKADSTAPDLTFPVVAP
jgi:hypothetical protein